MKLLPEDMHKIEENWFEAIDEVVFTQKHKIYNWTKKKNQLTLPEVQRSHLVEIQKDHLVLQGQILHKIHEEEYQ